MNDRRTQFGAFAIAALVFLRLVIGWHFFTQGAEKIGYDPAAGKYALTFSAAPFFSQAKGPLAHWFQSRGPNGHDWQSLLMVPKQSRPLTEEESAEQAKWVAEYQRRQKEAESKQEPAPTEFPPFESYYAWASRVVDDWRVLLQQASAVKGLTDEQKQKLADAFALRERQLAAYLEGESDAIAEWQHELWRLAQWQAKPEAADVPFQKERIATKKSETSAKAKSWVSQVDELEQGFVNDLRNVLTTEQLAQPATYAAMKQAIVSPRQSRLNNLNLAVTCLTIGVGICLLLGLFTRLAAVVGALFLLSVVAAQPFWVADAAPTINQYVELAGLLVIAGTGAGRWLGLDYFCHAWCCGCCAKST